jgi:hypothetical protein
VPSRANQQTVRLPTETVTSRVASPSVPRGGGPACVCALYGRPVRVQCWFSAPKGARTVATFGDEHVHW